MISFDTAARYFRSSFFFFLRNSLVPYFNNDFPSDRISFLRALHYDFVSRQYFPEQPREYIVSNKHNFVARVIPSFGYRDASAYFITIKALEDLIADNRVFGTYGGWRLGNPIRRREEAEFDLVLSMSINSFDPFAWVDNWRDFQKKVFLYSQQYEYGCFIQFDIANFYNSINLHLLEKNIRLLASADQMGTIDLLFVFLHYWNRIIEGYFPKSVGLPQDEIGDMSRILANFYLQPYDESIYRHANRSGSGYLRYSDDQLIFSQNCSIGLELLYIASIELHKLNLDINSSKVRVFNDRLAFERYWAFDIYRLLQDKYDYSSITTAVKVYFSWIDKNVDFRKDSVLTRLLSVDLTHLPAHLRSRLLAELLSDSFLSSSKYWMLSKLYGQLSDKERFELFAKLDSLIDRIPFNEYHYNLLKFYSQHRRHYDTSALLARINQLRLRPPSLDGSDREL